MRRAARPVAAALLLAAATGEPARAACAADRIEFRAEGGIVGFDVEVAADGESQAKGLMFREEMAAEAGMVFVYPDAAARTFWMKNTPLSLDIVFMNRRGLVCGIAAGTVPQSLEVIPSGCDAQIVLEVNAGVAEASGIRRGTAARRPEFLDPAWACE